MKNNKYKIFISDQSIITYDNVILENDLLYKKSIDQKLYKKILEDTSYYDIYNRVVKYILKKRRSEKEVKKYLQKFDIGEVQQNKMFAKLKQIKLIDDIEYCKAYINDKLYLSKCGINKIRNDLLNENIPLEIIEEYLNNIENNILDDRLEKLILKKIKSNKKYSDQFLKQKILNDMLNLGYEKSSILEIIDKNIKNDSNILENEFNKIYLKIEKKYSGLELKNKIRQKLYQKGFSIEEINELLNKKTED